jgi:broad specificity phosphatase PhoE
MARESDIRRSGDPQFRLMREEDPAWRPPGGETMADVRARTAAALGRIAQKHRHEEVLIVTHGTAIACMLAEVLQVAPTHTLRLETANCGLSCLVADRGRFSLALLNETSHLIGLGGHPQR